MANGHGGPRTPSDPAPVSGPGALSRRTDGGPAQKLRDVTGLPYGENAELNDMQAEAPLSQTPGPDATPAQSGPGDVPLPTPFTAPSMRPDEPVTAGVPYGPGRGPRPLPVRGPLGAQGYQSAKDALASVISTSGSPEAQALLSSLANTN